MATCIVAAQAGTDTRFWSTKAGRKSCRLFDACQICGPVGFFKGPNGLVCKNCSAPINGQSVGTPGGCNPFHCARALMETQL
jgi:uncharacterized membrane protein